MASKLHPISLSPDPLYERLPDSVDGDWQLLELFPHTIEWVRPGIEFPAAWLDRLDPKLNPGPVSLLPTEGELEFVVDFGCELEGSLELRVSCLESLTVRVEFGEVPWEARGWGLPSSCKDQRPREVFFELRTAGEHTIRCEEGGFRYARIWIVEISSAVTFNQIAVHSRSYFNHRHGDFLCPDPVILRLWQTAAYTARLCTWPEAFVDGIKRDRLGWYGDARITQAAVDSVFLNPGPALAMLGALPTNEWANGIPNYSFDALAMLKQVLLAHGSSHPGTGGVWVKAKKFLDWVISSQLAPDGRLTRCDKVKYFFKIGFTDWSPMPIGGRFEELFCLQASWLECLRDAALCAQWLDDADRAEGYSLRADALEVILKSEFRRKDGTYHHTLNLGVSPDEPWISGTEDGLHYRKSYVEKAAFGPSGPSLQSMSRAIWAGLVKPQDNESVLESTFFNSTLPPLITTYYHYYVQYARALCGDCEGALAEWIRFFAPMFTVFDTTTFWEHFDPAETGMKRWTLHNYPRSYCHGWGSGFVPWTTRFILGLESVAPGWSTVRLHPVCAHYLPLKATVPTPRGSIAVRRNDPDGPLYVVLPRDTTLIGEIPAGTLVKHR